MFRALILLSLLAVTVSGCGTPAVALRTDRATLRWGVVGISDVSTLDPALVSDATSISVASLIYGGLVRLDSRLRVRPDGARRWTISPDGTTYTFYLRHNLRFADGRYVTAADVVAALQRALGPDGSSGSAPLYLSLIAYPHTSGKGALREGIQALGPHKVRIILRRPAAHFLAELAFPASYVPEPALVRRFGQGWTDHAAGFGPYMVAGWRHGHSLRLVRNPYYYGGRPNLRSITIRFYSDATAALSAYRHHLLDLISGFEPGQNAPSRTKGTTRVPALALDYLAFNTTRFPFHHLNARRAFASVVTATPIATLMGSSAFPVNGFLPSALGVYSPSWQAKRRPAIYLRFAHYTARHPLPTVTFAVLRDPHVFALALALKQAWERTLGVSVLLRQLDASTYGTVLNAHGFDLALVRWGGDYPDPQDFLATQLGFSSDNVTGWTTKRYERLVAAADGYALSTSRGMTLYREAARLAARKLPLVPLDVPTQTAIVSPSLEAVYLTPLGTITGDWSRAGFR